MATPEDWVAKGDLDLKVAKMLLASDMPRVEAIVGFHAQQACEKYLKAALVAEGTTFPKVHDIARLRELVRSVAISEHLRPITRFAGLDRYPKAQAGENDEETLRAEVLEALQYAGMTRAVVTAVLDLRVDAVWERAEMADERTVAVNESIGKVREACDEIEAAWGKLKTRGVSDDGWERIETARNRLESAERRLRTLLETRPGSAAE